MRYTTKHLSGEYGTFRNALSGYERKPCQGHLLKYKDIISEANLFKSLKNLESETFSGLCEIKIRKRFPKRDVRRLFKSLSNHSYSVSSQQLSDKDKVVLSALWYKFQPRIQTVVSRHSWGYRMGRNAHGALKHVKNEWPKVNWLLRIDLSEYYSFLNRNIFFTSLTKFCDQATCELFRKLLKSRNFDLKLPKGIFDNVNFNRSSISPILSSIFFNVYFVNLDEFVEAFILKESSNKISYMRYGDELLLGFSGSKKEAEAAKYQLLGFLSSKFKIRVDRSKHFVTSALKSETRFLNCLIRFIKPKNKTLRGKVQLSVPVSFLLGQAVVKKYAKSRSKQSVRPTAYRALINSSDKDIIIWFSAIIKALETYYSPVNSYSSLWAVLKVYHKSCALTLADKHNLRTAEKAYEHYGDDLRVKDNESSNEFISLYYPKSLKTINSFKSWKVDPKILGIKLGKCFILPQLKIVPKIP